MKIKSLITQIALHTTYISGLFMDINIHFDVYCLLRLLCTF